MFMGAEMDPKLQVGRVHVSASQENRLAVMCRPVWQCGAVSLFGPIDGPLASI